MMLQRELQQTKQELTAKIQEQEKQLQNQIQLRQLDKQSVEKMNAQLQQHLNFSDQYIDQKLSSMVSQDTNIMTNPSVQHNQSINITKQEQYIKDIGKLKRENEGLRKYKVEDSYIKQKVISQAKEIEDLNEKLRILQDECKEQIQSLEKMGKSYRQPELLNDILLFKTPAIRQNVDHYYQSPKSNRFPSFDMNKVFNTHYEEKSQNNSGDDSIQHKALTKLINNPSKLDSSFQSFTNIKPKKQTMSIGGRIYQETDFEYELEQKQNLVITSRYPRQVTKPHIKKKGHLYRLK